MLYTTSSNLSHIKFYLKKKKISIEKEFSTEEEMNRILSSPMSINMVTLSVNKKVYVGELDIDPKGILCPNHMDIYLSTSKLSKDYLDLSTIYKEELNKIGFIFERDALEFFWDTFGDRPSKADKELVLLKDIFLEKRMKLTLSLLRDIYGSTETLFYPLYMGTERGSMELQACSPSERWTLFYKEKPLIYTLLIKRCPSLWHFIYSNMRRNKDESLAIDLLIRQTFLIDKKDPYNWKLIRKTYE